MDSLYDPPTPPMRRPKRTPKKAKTPAPKKNTFSASAFAKMALVNQQGIEELKPLPRPHLQRTMDSDDEQDILVSSMVFLNFKMKRSKMLGFESAIWDQAYPKFELHSFSDTESWVDWISFDMKRPKC